MGNSIQLTVQSKNGKAVTNYQQVFIADKLVEIIDNPQIAYTQTITEAGDGANQASAWSIEFGLNAEQKSVYYWGITYVSTTVTLWIWADSAHNFLVAKGSATIGGATGRVVANPQNSSGVTVSMLETMSAVANDVDSSNTLTINYVTPDTSQIHVAGATQIKNQTGDAQYDIYTVAETVSDIQTAIADTSALKTASVTLTSAEILASVSAPKVIVAAPGAGYILKFISGFVELDATSTAYATNVSSTIITTTTTTIQATATNGWSGTSDKVTRLIETAGVVEENEGFSVSTATGAPDTGTGTAKVVITYQVIAI